MEAAIPTADKPAAETALKPARKPSARLPGRNPSRDAATKAALSDRERVKASKGHRKPLMEPHANGTRMSNLRTILPNVDNRSLIARRYRDIMSAVVADHGGLDRCSATMIELIRRFSASAVLAERLESKLALGQEVSVPEHALLSSTLCRLAQRIGLRRIPKTIETPSLREYLDTLEAAERDAEPDETGEEAQP